MAEACAAAGAESGVVEGLLTSVDCHIGNLVQTGYGAVAGPDSHLLAGVTALLTIYIAVMGLRLMLGLGTLRVGELTLSAVKIGVVLALASNWPLYHQLVFQTLFHGPEQMAGELLMGSASARPIDGLHGALQLAFDEMQASAQFFAQKTPGGASPWLGGAGFSAAALNLSSVLMLVSTLGVLLGLKIVLAVVLLAGPLFIGFFLFQSTRGVFVGWARAAISLALAPLFALLSLVLELQLIQPHLGDLAMLRAQGGADASPAIAILVITLTTGLVTLVGLLACGALGMSLRLPSARSAQGPAQTSPAPVEHAGAFGPRPVFAGSTTEPPTRIASVAAAAAAMERRDSRVIADIAGRTTFLAGPGNAPAAPSGPTNGPGSGRRRAIQPSLAASSLRRDG